MSKTNDWVISDLNLSRLNIIGSWLGMYDPSVSKRQKMKYVSTEERRALRRSKLKNRITKG